MAFHAGAARAYVTPGSLDEAYRTLAKVTEQTHGYPARARVELKRLGPVSARDPRPPPNSADHLDWKQRQVRRDAERRKWKWKWEAELD